MSRTIKRKPPATVEDLKYKGVSQGSISGGIKGRRIDVTFHNSFSNTHHHRLIGEVGDDVKGHGTVPGFWSTVFPLSCKTASPPKPEEPQPAPAPEHMFTLAGDVDMDKHPGGKDEDKLPGFVEGGPGSPQVQLLGCEPDNWCSIITPDRQFVYVWGGFVPPEARF